MQLTEQDIFEAEMQKEFAEYCRLNGIKSEQFMDDIRKPFEFAYRAGAQNIMLGRYTGENGI
jgi:intergrase/recombinase